jgi:hypothetical protein
MGDSTVVANIPLTVQLVGVYRNGSYAADQATVAARFPANRYVIVWIDVDGSHAGSAQVLDVEIGDASPQSAPGWIKARRAAVHTSLPTIYCNRSTLPSVLAACTAQELTAGEHYQLWISTLDGTETWNGHQLRTVPGVVAVQVEGGMTAAWDRSIVYNPHWHPLG